MDEVCNSKVTQISIHVSIKEDVSGLQITMHNAYFDIVVQISQSISYIDSYAYFLS